MPWRLIGSLLGLGLFWSIHKEPQVVLAKMFPVFAMKGGRCLIDLLHIAAAPLLDRVPDNVPTPGCMPTAHSVEPARNILV